MDSVTRTFMHSAWKGWLGERGEAYGAETTRFDDEGIGEKGGIARPDRRVGGVLEIGGLVVGGLRERESEIETVMSS